MYDQTYNIIMTTLRLILLTLVPGLDYVGHEDILPYATTEKQPIQNHLFDKFLALDNDSTKGMVN